MLALGLGTAGAVIVLDQLSKWAILALLDQAIAVTPFLNLVVVWNRGVSFGMFDSASAHGPWLLSGLAVAVVVALVFWLRRVDHPLPGIALGLIIGGALGNVLDRVRYGAVVDFLDVHALGYHWPAFNVADSAICVGAALLLVDGLLAPRRQIT
ncbi:MAG TPA: signal peptidase II [Geminicoccaceae bacterium]|nr:signal peptidase II [Geminicoccaceae bacterium]HZA66079.1 signal peptidase II [Geminicoccaceae bacterium]